MMTEGVVFTVPAPWRVEDVFVWLYFLPEDHDISVQLGTCSFHPLCLSRRITGKEKKVTLFLIEVQFMRCNWVHVLLLVHALSCVRSQK